MSDLINDKNLPDIDPARAAGTPDVDWSDFDPESDDPVVVAPSPVATPAPTPTPAAPPAPSAPAAPAVQAPVQPPAPPSTPAPVAPAAPMMAPIETPPVSATPPAPAPQAPAPQTPAPSFEEQRAARMAALQARYAIPADKVPELLTEPEKAIPALLAAAHDNALMESAQMFVQAMPQLVQKVLADQANEEKAKAAFYTAWPELVGNDAVVQQVGSFYRQNVKADSTPEEAIRRIGELAMVALGKQRVATPSPAAPLTPQGFRPAGVSTPAQGTPVGEENVFAKLVDEWMAEDQRT